MKLKAFGVLLLSIVQVTVFASQQDDAAKLSEKVTSPFRDNSLYTVKFKASAGANIKSIEGVLMVSGDKYRVETEDNTLFCDGGNRYNYIPKNEEIYIEKVNANSQSIMDTPQKLLSISGSNNAVIDGVSNGITRLRYPEYGITLYVKQDNSISKIEVLDENRKSVTIEVVSVDFKTALSPKLFSFDKYNYKETEIIDLR